MIKSYLIGHMSLMIAKNKAKKVCWFNLKKPAEMEDFMLYNVFYKGLFCGTIYAEENDIRLIEQNGFILKWAA